MTTYRRDAALAGVAGTALLGVLAARGALATLADPRAVTLGVAAGVVVESVFLANSRVSAAWQRRGIALAGAIVLVAGVAVLAAVAGPVLVAAACWGLVVYFCVLALALAGVVPGAVA